MALSGENQVYYDAAVNDPRVQSWLRTDDPQTTIDNVVREVYQKEPEFIMAMAGQQVARGFSDAGYWPAALGGYQVYNNPAFTEAIKKYALDTQENRQASANWQQYMSPEAQAARSDEGGLFGDSLLNSIGGIAAAYFGGPLGAAAYTGASGGDVGDMALAGGLTYAGGQLSGTGSGAPGGSWYSPSGDLGGMFSGGANIPGPGGSPVAQSFPVDMSSGPQLLSGGGNMDFLDVGAEVARDVADFGIDGAASAWGINAQDLATFADDPSALGMLAGGAAQGATAGMASSGWLSNIVNSIKSDPMGAVAQGLKAAGLVGADGKVNVAGMLAGGMNTVGGIIQGQSAAAAAEKQAAAQIEAAKIAAEAARFKPVGVTTRFGSSNFGFDDKGNLNSAGYTLTPEMKAQQDALMATSGGLLNQFRGAQAATAPMGDAAQRAMRLGQGYLATDPAAQAQKYMAEQQALLAPTRERQMASTLQGEFNRGTYGLGTGSTSTGMMAANPRLEALMNAQRQQDLGLAAQATQGGMDYAKFGTAMTGLGGNLLSQMYGTQTAAYAPYQTALGGATTIEGLGQNALQTGIDLGKTATTASANAGALLGTGMTNAANTVGQTAQQVGSTWGNILQGAGGMLNKMATPQQQQQQMIYNPYTGQPINWSV